MTAPPPPPEVADSSSLIGDMFASLPPLLRAAAVGGLVLMLVCWGPWAWAFGGLAALYTSSLGWPPDAVMLLGFVAAAAGYLLHCLWMPVADCLWCKGSPKRRDRVQQRTFHFCFVCGGSGRRTRLGALAWPGHRART